MQNRRASGRSGITGGQIAYVARSRTGWQVAEQGANGKIGGLEPNPESYRYGPNIPFIASST